MRNLTIDEVLIIVNEVFHESEDDDLAGIFPPLSKDQTDTDFNDIQIDSITFIKIIVALESEFELEIPDEYLLMTEMNSVSKIFEVLKSIKESQDKEFTLE